jgi:hypothetical protein
MQVATEIAIRAQPATIAQPRAIEPNHLSDACIERTPPACGLPRRWAE